MAITKSAKKALRVSKRKKLVNDKRRRAMREAVRDVKQSAGKENAEVLAKAYKAIDKAAKRGVLNKRTAARRKSLAARTLRAK